MRRYSAVPVHYNPIKKLSNKGFTIVETLIVLTITGILFMSVVTMVEGKRQTTEFKQSTNAIKGQIEQVMSEVQSGYFPSGPSFSCSVSFGNVNFPSASATEQGANRDCVFLGKVLQFSKSAYGTDPQQYSVYTIAGRRQNIFMQPVTEFTDSDPTLVPALTVINPLQYGLQIKRM